MIHHGFSITVNFLLRGGVGGSVDVRRCVFPHGVLRGADDDEARPSRGGPPARRRDIHCLSAPRTCEDPIHHSRTDTS